MGDPWGYTAPSIPGRKWGTAGVAPIAFVVAVSLAGRLLQSLCCLNGPVDDRVWRPGDETAAATRVREVPVYLYVDLGVSATRKADARTRTGDPFIRSGPLARPCLFLRAFEFAQMRRARLRFAQFGTRMGTRQICGRTSFKSERGSRRAARSGRRGSPRGWPESCARGPSGPRPGPLHRTGSPA